MKNPYTFGFYSACLALIVLVLAVQVSARTDTVHAWGVVNSASAIIEALAAAGIAGVAFAAFGAWKRDVRQHKTLSILWDVNVAFREIEIGFNEWFFGPGTEQQIGQDKERLGAMLNASPFGQALRTFKKQSILLDKVVLRQDWCWIGYAAELDMLARTLSNEYFTLPEEGRCRSAIVDFLYPVTNQARQRAQAQWETLINTIELELGILEKRYA